MKGRSGEDVPLFEVRQGQLVESGVQPSPFELDAQLWSSGENVEFREGQVRKAAGYTEPNVASELFDDAAGNFDSAPGLFDDGGPSGSWSSPLTGPVRGVQAQRIAGTAKVIYFGDQTTIARFGGGSVTSPGTGYAGIEHETEVDPATVWSFTEFGEWVIWTNGIDRIQVNKDGSAFATLANSPATARIVRTLGPHVLAFQTDDYPCEFCKEGDPEVWDPATNVTAGALLMEELQSPIEAAERLHEGALGVYGSNEMHIVRYVRPPLMFGSKPALVGGAVGAVSRNAIVPVGSAHFGFSQNSIFLTDGVGVQYLDPPYIREWIQDNVNFGQKSKIFGFDNPKQRRVTWFVPTTDLEPMKGIGIGYDNRTWTFYNYGRTAGASPGVFQQPLLGDANGDVWLHESGVNANGSALAASVRTKPLDCGDVYRYKFLDSFSTRIKEIAGTGVKVRVGFQDSAEDSAEIEWGKSISGRQGQIVNFLEEPRSSLYIRFEITASKVDDDFILAGFALLGALDGSSR